MKLSTIVLLIFFFFRVIHIEILLFMYRKLAVHTYFEEFCMAPVCSVCVYVCIYFQCISKTNDNDEADATTI